MTLSMSAQQFYAGKSILITGSTGFMGKVLVEKLLRSCPDIDQIYLLLRPKKGQNSKERLEDFVNFRIFDTMHEQKPSPLSKLRLVAGDILQPNLGMSQEDRDELAKNCQVVFHCAACVRFDQNLRDAVNLNTGGTKRVLDLVEKMEKLEVFVHVSTAYCRCELDVLEESLYATKHKPQDVMDVVQWMDHDLLAYLEKKLIEPQPNTYAYTKSLTEELVSHYAGRFPIAVARPSIVTASYKEPMPGWVDNLNGPTGLLVGAGKGVIRTMLCNEDYFADIIPVDIVVNACVLLAYRTAVLKPKEIQVMNIAESGLNPITWGDALELGRHHVKEFPFSTCLWYPGGSIKRSRALHAVAALLTHSLPARIIDAGLRIAGQKPFMVRIQKKVSSGLEVLQYYTTKQWHFRNTNFAALKDQVSDEDNKTFYTDVKALNWSAYIRDYVRGAREFCCKEDPSTLPQARRLNRQLYYADLALKTLILTLIAYLIFSYTKILFSVL